MKQKDDQHTFSKIMFSILGDLVALWAMGFFKPTFPDTTLGSFFEILYGILIVLVLIFLPKLICKFVDAQ